MLLGGNVLIWAVQQAQLQRTAWASVIVLVSAIVVLLALSARAWFDPASTLRQRWPLDRFADAYLWRAAAPVALLVTLGCLAVAVHSDGNARPLPYVPLLNPTDLSVALGLAACALWLMRLRQSTLAVPVAGAPPTPAIGVGGNCFVAINTVWLRVAHQFAGVPWNAERLFESFLVQAGYSILWTLIALGLMIVAHRRQAPGVDGRRRAVGRDGAQAVPDRLVQSRWLRAHRGVHRRGRADAGGGLLRTHATAGGSQQT
ncbi:MAG: DUF2339 domain-containing protein [Rhodoferax sp.]|nr:DUF2339 domain-containing protein [Rhodoferax sp.]